VVVSDGSDLEPPHSTHICEPSEGHLEMCSRGHHVPIWRIDDLLTSLGLNVSNVDMLKVDAEGHDLHILRGAELTLARRATHGGPVVAFEMTESCRDELMQFFDTQGFSVTKVNPALNYAVRLADLPTWMRINMNGTHKAMIKTITYKQISVAADCCRNNGALLGKVDNSQAHSPSECEGACNANDSCKYFSHSLKWANCVLCSKCDFTTTGKGAKYTSWERQAITQWFAYTGGNSYTWSAANAFCSSHGGKLCTKAQYCPNDSLSMSIGGSPNGQTTGDKWSPYRDAKNGWIQTGSGGPHAPNARITPILDLQLGAPRGQVMV